MRDFIRSSALPLKSGRFHKLSRRCAALFVVSCVVYVAPYAAALGGMPGPGPNAPLPTATDALPNSLVKWEMIQLPAGSIEMPDPDKPGVKKAVQVKKIWMAKSEVPWELYDVYAFRLDLTDEEKAKNVDAESRPSKPYGAPDRGFGHQGYPALSMHYNAAQFFCKWLSAKTGKKYRIPTDAEWEYACRAGATSVPKYDDKALEDIAWFWENADDKTHPSGQKKPNVWGFLDMLGNAAEWVTMPDGKGALAGGSYNDKADKVQPGARDFYKPEWQAEDAHTPKSKWWLSNGPFVGMRIVRED